MQQNAVTLFPADGASGVNPDTHLVIHFPGEPVLGTSGQVRIYDTADGRLVDLLDLSIPPGPTLGIKIPERPPYSPAPYEYTPGGRPTNANTKAGTPSGAAWPTPDTYQLTIIGGFTDGFHFYPIILHGNVATIYLHHNLLEYGRTYSVQIDPGVLTLADDGGAGGGFAGISEKTGWTFTTKAAPPFADARRLVVSADGVGADFNTVQGAIDFIPDDHPERVTVFIKNGVYEEIVYFRNKSNITFIGEDREKTLICYANNEVFNPHPENVATNEMPGTFPERRVVFMGDHSSGIHLVNLTLRSTAPRPGQAEALLLVGGENIVSHVTIDGSGDALQANDSIYLSDCTITGDGDNILGRGPAFFYRCELVTTGGPHMWIRNTAANQGNVFLNCTFRSSGEREAVIARSPTNHGKDYPYSEAVLLHCALAGIRPEGWGPIGGGTTAIHYWEYHSTNLSDGQPVDASQRHPASRQLDPEKDAQIIACYSDPAWVLGGWSPRMAPVILQPPQGAKVEQGHSVVLRVSAAAAPEAEYQWLKDGQVMAGETGEALRVEAAGRYTVRVWNLAGEVVSEAAEVRVI